MPEKIEKPKKPKLVRVLIEIQENWVDFESPLGFASSLIKDEVERKIHTVLVEQYVKKIKLPDLKITKKELKKAVINKMAEEALRKDNDY